jgi:tetrapyrrole methylase family protein/MazG family protein
LKDLESAFRNLYDVIVRLRGPDGCPWDREQTALSLRGDLVEETYECIEAITQEDPPHIKEELGDIFLLATMLSYIHQQEGLFTITDVLEGISEKLIRRHPHVFSNLIVKDSEEVLDNWERIKVEKEGRKLKDSILDDVKSGLPPLDRAFALQKKAAKLGFDWPDINGVVAKIEEELTEVQEVLNSENSHHEEELGDLLFSVVNFCRFLKVDPSAALIKTNAKFIRRFQYMEKKMKQNEAEMKHENLSLMDKYWEEAKTSLS